MNNDREKYLTIIKDIDIISELEKRDIVGKISGSNLMVCCPIYSEQNPSMGIRLDGNKKGIFNCYSCGQKGDFIKLISFIDDVSYEEAMNNYRKDFFDLRKINEIKYTFRKFLDNDNEEKNKIKVINRDFLKHFKKPYGKFMNYLVKERKLNKEIIDKFGLLCCDKDVEGVGWKDRVIIPIEDEKSRLIGVTARYIHDCDKSFKVRKIKDSDISKVLFGLKYIEKKSPLVCVEGEFDTIYFHQFNIPAVQSGINPSKYQVNKIVNFTNHVYIALDGDVKYIDNERQSIKNFRKKVNGFIAADIVMLPDKKDPNDLNKQEVHGLLGDLMDKKFFKKV